VIFDYYCRYGCKNFDRKLPVFAVFDVKHWSVSHGAVNGVHLIVQMTQLTVKTRDHLTAVNDASWIVFACVSLSQQVATALVATARITAFSHHSVIFARWRPSIPPPNTWFLGPTPLCIVNAILVSSAIFCMSPGWADRTRYVWHL